MAECKPKNSQLIQQLCKHIASLQQTNTRLNEQLIKNDNEKQLVCAAFGVTSWQQIIDGLQNKESKGKGEIGFADTLSSLTGKVTFEEVSFREPRTPLRKKDNNQSACQSPIESQSRIINKQIRGGTDRSQEADPWCSKQGNKKDQNCRMFNYSLDDIAGHSISKENLLLKSWEQENMLLSVENTKLRQRVAKLQAFVVSRENY